MCFPQTSICLNTFTLFLFAAYYRRNSRLEGLKLLCGVQSREHLWRSIKCINVWVLRVENRILFPRSQKYIVQVENQFVDMRSNIWPSAIIWFSKNKLFHVNDFLSSLSNLGLCYFHFFPHQPSATTYNRKYSKTLRHLTLWRHLISFVLCSQISSSLQRNLYILSIYTRLDAASVHMM